MTDADLTSFSVKDFLDRLASADPTPGGGSVAALAGALAASLVCMVCNLTLGREKFAEVESDVRLIREHAEELRQRLLAAVSADASAYAAVISAFRLPRETEAAREVRQQAIQSATREAARIPLEVSENCSAILELCQDVVDIANPHAASDVAVAALLAGAASEAAAANVETNLVSIKDERFNAEARQRLAAPRSGRDARVTSIVERSRERRGG